MTHITPSATTELRSAAQLDARSVKRAAYGLPARQGLYDPRNEHDACGVGFIANMKNVRSHQIVLDGLAMLEHLTHRGAVGADPLMGDGAGVLVILRDLVPDAVSRRLSGVPAELEGEDELRVIGLGSQILHELGVGRMIVLGNTPQKLVGLEGYGLTIEGWRGFKS